MNGLFETTDPISQRRLTNAENIVDRSVVVICYGAFSSAFVLTLIGFGPESTTDKYENVHYRNEEQQLEFRRASVALWVVLGTVAIAWFFFTRLGIKIREDLTHALVKCFFYSQSALVKCWILIVIFVTITTVAFGFLLFPNKHQLRTIPEEPFNFTGDDYTLDGENNVNLVRQ